jgi:hypothetical protein
MARIKARWGVRLSPFLVMSDLSFIIGFTIRLARPIDAPDDVVATLPFFKARRCGRSATAAMRRPQRQRLEPVLADLPLPKTPEAAILARQLTRNRGNVR